MTLNLEDEYGLELGIDYEGTASLVISQVLEEEGCPYEAEVNLLLTSNEEIHRMNREYRDVDRPTDVLSFPMLEFDENGECYDAEYEMDGDFVILGDIVISLERAMEQALEYGHSFRREVAFLTAHSMLHLLGYDHVDDPEGERIMREKQNKVLNSLGITRDAV